MCQQEYVIHTDAQCQEGQHLEGPKGWAAGETEQPELWVPKSALQSWCTCVVAALKAMPSRAQSPSPEATARATSSTPARPTAPWDWAQSHRSIVTQA